MSASRSCKWKALAGTGEQPWMVQEEVITWIFALAPPEPGEVLMWPCMSNSPNEGLENGNSLGFGQKQTPLFVAVLFTGALPGPDRI